MENKNKDISEAKSASEEIKEEKVVQTAETAEAPEVKEEVKQAENQPEKSEKAEEKPEVKSEETSSEEVSEDDQNAKFGMTVKQVWKVITGFCSKNAVETISSCYSEKLPIWSILLPVYILFSAASETATFNSTRSFSPILEWILSKGSYGSGEIFFITVALEVVYSFALILGVRSFIRYHKGDGHFANSANLVSATTLPITMLYLLNVITGGALSFIINPLTELGLLAMFMMLFSGISKEINGKKPIWSFFLMLIIVIAVTAVITIIVISPIIFSSVAYSIIDSIKK